MKRFKKNLLATAITALLAGMSVGAADAKTELKLATLAPEGTPWYAWLAEWRDKVAKASNSN
jgi:TRAP-type C4-dicarboxylate transport system substrate-binding protein